eukprot:gene16524-17288_t
MLGSIEGTEWADAHDNDDEAKKKKIKKPLSDVDAEGIVTMFAEMKQ